MTASVVTPRFTEIGEGVVDRLPSILEGLGVTGPLVVTDRPLVENGVIDGVLQPLRVAGIEVGIFDEVSPDPTTEGVAALAEALEEGGYDSLVAIGGGSPMDTAKAAGILRTYPGTPLRDLKAPHTVGESSVPLVCVPTTAGTGSEMTRFTIITDVETNEKMLISGPGCVAIAAVIDVDLSLSMPPSITRDTGVDALTHGLEAFLSHRASPHSDLFAISGVRKVLENLPTVWDHPEDKEARAEMMLGATHAGMAFSASSVALIHGMSRPMGAFFHVPHGRANAMLLGAVLDWTRPRALERLAELARATGVADAAASTDEAADALQQRIGALLEKLDVPTPKAFGIDEQEWLAVVPTMAEQALASGSPANNPGDPSAEDIRSLYRKIWGSAAA
ncbi:alcohol dehydrogenase [Brachybacterium endophyticum]|uniref:Alcohol dehydrogenase n=1 Tax=Brachybacterium endophyticum TaxID=2182385 RepID=A0A2U2RHF3_9MICO|nr:iron-containing alcohol dehydrogenase [Brachybacterium endophyticum]PWH05303.1 alcohol dehydrogenase [Brachybacterium endophyticum]